MENCVFCKIVNGEIPSLKIYEDEYTLVFMAKSEDVDGHMLVIPKKHVINLFDCNLETINQIMFTVKKVSNYCVNECGYSGVNLLHASNESAGQSIPHFHIHLIPRKNNDNIDAWPKFTGTNLEREEVYKKLKMS